MTRKDSRSLLYVPAIKPALFDKAVRGETDAVIIDLEDAVPVSQKASARVAVGEWLKTREPTNTEIWVRVAPEFLAEDLDAAAQSGVAGIMIAKCSTATLARADALLTELESTRTLDTLAVIGLLELPTPYAPLPRWPNTRVFAPSESARWTCSPTCASRAP